MKKLKIVDNVDLKELDKYLKKLTIMNDNKVYVDYETNKKCKDLYCFVNRNDNRTYGDNIEKGYIDSFEVQFYFNSHKEMSCCTYPEFLDIESICCKVYELTKANLVEVVEDE